jgi:hypothetical protein
MLYSFKKFEELHRETSALQRREGYVSRRKHTEKIACRRLPRRNTDVAKQFSFGVSEEE